MFVIIGIVVVFACVLGGYVAMGGKLGVLCNRSRWSSSSAPPLAR